MCPERTSNFMNWAALIENKLKSHSKHVNFSHKVLLKFNTSYVSKSLNGIHYYLLEIINLLDGSDTW